jgi:hypothetical protein
MHIFKLVYSSWTKSNYFFSMNNYCSIFFKTLWNLLYTFMLLRASPKIITYLIWSKNIGYRLWLLRLTPLSTMLKLYHGGQFYWWSTRKKPPTCRKSLTIFITKCCIEYASPWTGFELTTLVMIGIDCIGSSKSNYYTITTIGLKTPINVIYMRRKGSWLSSEVEYFTNKFHGCNVFYTMNSGQLL